MTRRKPSPPRGPSADAIPISACRPGDLVVAIDRINYGPSGYDTAFGPGQELRVMGTLAGGVLVRIVVDGTEGRQPVVVDEDAMVRVAKARQATGEGTVVVDPLVRGAN